MKNFITRITLNPEVCKGAPTIRNMRFTVSQMLELLASGMSEKEILKDYPYVEKEDIYACLQYASRVTKTKSLVATKWEMVPKFIVDTQLPPSLVQLFKAHGFNTIHTTDFKQGHLMNDSLIRKIAISQDRIIVTKDTDFYENYFLKGAPPKILLIKLGNTGNAELFKFIEVRLERVKKYFSSKTTGLVILEKEEIVVY